MRQPPSLLVRFVMFGFLYACGDGASPPGAITDVIDAGCGCGADEPLPPPPIPPDDGGRCACDECGCDADPVVPIDAMLDIDVTVSVPVLGDVAVHMSGEARYENEQWHVSRVDAAPVVVDHARFVVTMPAGESSCDVACDARSRLESDYADEHARCEASCGAAVEIVAIGEIADPPLPVTLIGAELHIDMAGAVIIPR